MKTLKPTLFSTPMVQAIMDDRKTQTRRTIKFQSGSCMFCGCTEDNCIQCIERSGEPCHWITQEKTICSACIDFGPITTKAKYQVGDILWVRETTKVGAWDDENAKVAFDYKASPELKNTDWVDYEDLGRFQSLLERCIEKLEALGVDPTVDEENERIWYKWEAGQSPFKWTPSIHMPFEAARIFLKVTDVRVENLQDISENDAIAEGILEISRTRSSQIVYKNYINDSIGFVAPENSFKSLWESINGKDSWNKNPFVWVYDFERTEKPQP